MCLCLWLLFFFFSSRRRHTRYWRDWSSDVCSSDLQDRGGQAADHRPGRVLVPNGGLERLRTAHGAVRTPDLDGNGAGPETERTQPPEIGRAAGRERG